MCGTPGVLASSEYLGCLRNSNCREVMPVVNFCACFGMGAIGMIVGASFMVCDRFHPAAEDGERGDGSGPDDGPAGQGEDDSAEESTTLLDRKFATS